MSPAGRTTTRYGTPSSRTSSSVFASRSSCSSHELSGSVSANCSTLLNWWTRNIPRVSLPAAPRRLGEQRRLADDSLNANVVLGCAVRDVVGGRVRDPKADLIARRLSIRQLALDTLQLLLDAAQLLELLGGRLALDLRART